LPANLLGQLIDYAHGRTAYARSAADNADRTGVLHALHQLKGICAHTADDSLVARIHHLEDTVLQCVTAEAITHALRDELPAIEAALEQLDPRGDAIRTLALDDIVARAGVEARRIAARRDIDLALAPTAPTGAIIPARTAMMVLDVIGHLVRNAVVHGAGDRQVNVVFTVRVDPDMGLTWEVTNHGRLARGTDEIDIDSGRGVALDAVGAELARNGGRLEHGPLPDGYRAVIHLPSDSLHETGVHRR
jgi:HPt (histidine-containing phosphotransfer) domain-containing protein